MPLSPSLPWFPQCGRLPNHHPVGAGHDLRRLLTVKKALTKVEGVTKAEVSYEKREAIVTFDDAKTSAQALTKATEDAGYPSSVKQ